MIKRIVLLNLVFSISMFSQTITINLNNPESDSLLKDLSGIISGPIPSIDSDAPNLTEQLHDIGITSIRNNDYGTNALDMERMFNSLGPLTSGLTSYPNWKGSPSDTNNYHWGASDTLFQSIIEGGFEPFFRVGGEMASVIREHDYKGPRADEETNYIEAAKIVVKRYLEFNGVAQNFEYLDLWTEYPGAFWDRTPDAFNEFWKNLFVALKEEFPQLKIGGPGFLVDFFEDPSTSKKIKSAISFLTKLYETNNKPDWLGFHYINNDILSFEEDIIDFKKLLAGTTPFDFVPWHGTDFFNDAELICDAYMLAKSYQDSLGNFVELTPMQIDELYNRSKGASLLTAQWIILQRNRIEKAYYYRAGDSNSDPSLSPVDPNQKMRRGLFWGNTTGDYKKTAYGFKLQNSLWRDDYKHLLKFEDQMDIGEADSLWTIAAEKDSNNFVTLISNISSKAKNVSLVLNGEQINPGNYDIQFKVVNKNYDGDTWKTLRSNDIFISPYSVTLIQFSKKVVSVLDENNHDFSYKLLQNYPNPFNPSTTIQFALPKAGMVSLKIYNIRGEEVTELMNREMNAGFHSVNFDALSVNRQLSSGLYFCRISAGNTSSGSAQSFVDVKKMLLLK